MSTIIEKPKALFSIELDVPFHASKKNGQRVIRIGGRPSIRASKRAEFLEKFYINEFSIIKNRNLLKSLKTPLRFEAKFYYKDFLVKSGPNRGRVSSRVHDQSNLYEVVQDALTKAKIIKDDRIIRSHDGSETLPGDRDRLVLNLYELSDYPFEFY